MKKILLCMCLELSLLADNPCDTYLKQADDVRKEVEKVLLRDSAFSSNEKIKIFLKYTEILQDRYLICMKTGK